MFSLEKIHSVHLSVLKILVPRAEQSAVRVQGACVP